MVVKMFWTQYDFKLHQKAWTVCATVQILVMQKVFTHKMWIDIVQIINLWQENWELFEVLTLRHYHLPWCKTLPMSPWVGYKNNLELEVNHYRLMNSQQEERLYAHFFSLYTCVYDAHIGLYICQSGWA